MRSHSATQALEGSRLRLACDVSVDADVSDGDSVTLILWFKADRKSTPIYSVDARSVNQLTLATHHSSDPRIRFHLFDQQQQPPDPSASTAGVSVKPFKRRKTQSSSTAASVAASTASFEVTRRQSKGFLTIDHVTLQDAGDYVCRVDFKWSRTVSSITSVTVVGESVSRSRGCLRLLLLLLLLLSTRAALSDECATRVYD